MMMNFKMTSALALILWTARAVAVPASLQARSQQSCDNACAGNEMQDPWHQAQCCRDLVDYCAEQMSTQDLEMTRWKQAGFDQCDTVYLKKTPKDCRDELLSVDEVLAIDLTSSSTALKTSAPSEFILQSGMGDKPNMIRACITTAAAGTATARCQNNCRTFVNTPSVKSTFITMMQQGMYWGCYATCIQKNARTDQRPKVFLLD